MRALIVDDSRFVRGYLRSLLEEMNFEREEACDGQAGHDLLHDEALAEKPAMLGLVEN